MKSPKGILLLVIGFWALWGCSSVTFEPAGGELRLPPKGDGYEVKVLDRAAAAGYRIIGRVSCQDSASSSIWNWWTDNQALIREMKAGNLDRLLEKVREVGGEALIGLKHDILTGGSSGGLGLGVGVGSGPVGLGVGTGLLGGNPKIIVVSYGDVGVTAAPSD